MLDKPLNLQVQCHTNRLIGSESRSGLSGESQLIAKYHEAPHGRVVGEPCLKWPYFREIQVGEIL